MEINNESTIMKLFASSIDKSGEKELTANQLTELINYLKSDPQYADIIASLEDQVNPNQQYSLSQVSGWSKVNLQSTTLSSLVGNSTLYSNSGEQFYNLMDTIFYEQENKDGTASDQIDLSVLNDNFGVTTGLAATINKAR